MASGNKQKQQQMSYWDTQAQTNAQHINDVDPAEQAIRDQNKRFLDWENSPNHNIGDAPGLQDTIQIGHAAIARQDREKMGSGALQLGEGGTQPYLANLKELKKQESAQEYGANLEDALGMRRAEVHGSVLPYAQLMTNRRVAAAGNSSQMFNNWSGVQTGTPWWQTLLGGASQAAGAYLGRPGCWVAEAIYGAEDPRTHLLRAWLNLEFKNTFPGSFVMAFYLTFGELTARQVHKFPILKKVLRPLFERGLTRARKWATR